MNVILTSDFPSSAAPEVVERLKAPGARPAHCVDCPRHERWLGAFALAQARFAEFGIEHLEYCDIDQEPDDVQLAYLHEFDVVYLSGGDPVRFRYNMLRTGAGGRLRQCLARRPPDRRGERRFAAADARTSRSVRLQSESVDDVLATTRPLRRRWVRCHTRFCRTSTAATTRSSTRSVATPNASTTTSSALADGGAMFHDRRDAFEAVGDVTRFRNGARGDDNRRRSRRWSPALSVRHPDVQRRRDHRGGRPRHRAARRARRTRDRARRRLRRRRHARRLPAAGATVARADHRRRAREKLRRAQRRAHRLAPRARPAHRQPR